MMSGEKRAGARADASSPIQSGDEAEKHRVQGSIWCSLGNHTYVVDHKARKCVGVLRKTSQDVEGENQELRCSHRALMNCALGPGPAVQAMRDLKSC